jgi:hypothetical protein
MCTFEGPEDEDDNYATSIQRIIKSLPARSVRQLASLPTDDGKPLVDKDIPQCTQVIRDRLDQIAKSEIPIPKAPLSSGLASNVRSFLLRQWDEDMASRFSLQEVSSECYAVHCSTSQKPVSPQVSCSFLINWSKTKKADWAWSLQLQLQSQ